MSEAEKTLFQDAASAAAFGSPFDATVVDCIDQNGLGKLLWASEHSTVTDILWALTLKATELGVPDPPTEQETVNLIVALTWAYSYLMEHDEKRIRRNAVETLLSRLARLVGLLPGDIWASDFLDDREDVLRLICDWVSAGE